MKKILIPVLLLMLSVELFSQQYAQAIILPGLKEQMVKDWERAKEYTIEYLNAMPADKYSFKPNDSLRSFAEQMLHLSLANAGMASIGTGVRNIGIKNIFLRPNFEKTPAAQDKDSVVYYVNTSYDFVIDAIKNMDFGKLDEVVTWDLPRGKRSATRLGWLLKAFEHQTHHRGQTTIYIPLLNIRPPNERLFE